MRLIEIIGDSESGNVPEGFPHIIIEISGEVAAGLYIPLRESHWVESKISGIYYRIDPENPQMKQKRHVHVATKKHINTATKQASWNDDGTRHDRHKFNDVFGSTWKAQDVARTALSLSDDIVLEALQEDRRQLLMESDVQVFEGTEIFRAVKKYKPTGLFL